jgi:hypothetical protein
MADEADCTLTKEPPSPGELRSQAELELYKAKLTLWVEQNKVQLAAQRERRQTRLDLQTRSHVSTIEFARGVFRGGMILNGGGSLATTTMIAATLQRSGAVDSINVLLISLGLFSLGTLLPVVGNGFSYFAQLRYSATISRASPGDKAGTRWRQAAIACLTLSALCFVGGVCWTKVSLPGALAAAAGGPSKGG